MTRLPSRLGAAALAALMTLGVLVRTPSADAQSVSNFAADVNTAVNRGIEYLDRFGAFVSDPSGLSWSGPAAGLVSLALLEKRVDASPNAVSQGYARATAVDKARIDKLVRSMVLFRTQPFEAYQNGSEMMGLSLYVRTGGLQSTALDAGVHALDALDQAVDESLDPIDFSVSPPRLVSTGNIWTGYWTYGDAGGYDASGTQFIIAGLSAARGAYMVADRGGRLAKINQALAYTRAVYAGEIDPDSYPGFFTNHALQGQPCSPGGPLSASELGKGYGLPWITCTPADGILAGVSNSSQQTASGLWIQLVGGSNLNSTGIQAYLEWLRNRYQHSTLNGQAFSHVSYGYYLWTATKAYAFLDRSSLEADPGNLSTADLGVLTPGTGSVWAGSELHLNPATAGRPMVFGPGGVGYYDDVREQERWYFDFAYDVISRQCYGGQLASLTIPPSNAGGEGIPANPCVAGGSDGYFVPVNGRWPGWEKNVAEQVFHILVLQRSVGGSCIDTDNDGLCDTEDNCPSVVNEDQADGDGDGVGDACDNCAPFYNPDQIDADANGIGDACATPPTIEANDDSGTTTTAGGVAVVSVLPNDVLNGLAILPTAVNTAFVSATHPNIGLSGNSVIVAANTPAGVYNLVYRICEVLNPDNCDGANVVVTVTDGTGAVIDAVNDTAAVVDGSTGNASVLDVLADNGNGPDTLDGVPGTAGTVTVVSYTATHANITMTGSVVSVGPGTPTGTYNLHYRLCVAIALTPCDEADVTIPVVMPGIDAINDAGVPVSSAVGGVSVPTVLVNDTLGPNPALLAEVDLSELSSTHPGVSLNTATGSVVVAPGTPAGEYELEYEICESISAGGNCDVAIVPVPVVMGIVVANDDAGTPLNGLLGGTSFTNILVNDTVDGAPAVAGVLDIVQLSTTSTGVHLSGVDVLVDPNTPAGNYELVYEICISASAGGSCDVATVTVPVTWAAIDAVNDAGAPVTGTTGGVSLANVLVNDTIAGIAATTTNVVISYVSGSAGLSLNTATGAVSVAANTPASPVGTPYTLTYRICEQLNPTNCDTAVVTVPVTGGLIDAVDDIGNAVNGTSGGDALLSVLVNDTLSGLPVAYPAVNLTYVSGTPGLVLSTTSPLVSVTAGTPANPAATLTYRICEKLNPANCDTATVTVPIIAPPIDAFDDMGNGVNGASGGVSLATVFVNDLLNGAAANNGNVSLSYVSGTPGLVLDTVTGAVSVSPGTPVNPAATLTYRICERLNPANCDTAVVTVPVLAPPIDAVDDIGTPVSGAAGGPVLASVLAADTLNSVGATTGTVTIHYVGGTPGLVLNLVTGAVSVAPNTPANPAATLTYRICEILNPSNCDTATVTVAVTAAPIDAVNDNGAPVNGASGGVALANVLVNDTLDGGAATFANVTLSFVSGSAGLVLNAATGAVSVLPGTPANPAATLTYRICEVINPTNCDTAVVTVPVTAAPIDAVDDAGAPVNGASGGLAVANVLVNDTLSGQGATLATVVLSYVSGTPGLVLNPATGAVTVTAGTPANPGATLTYRICEVLNPTNCDTATVTVPVIAPPIDAVDDAGVSVSGLTGGTALANVLVNDTLNGVPAGFATVTLSYVSGTPGLSLNAATGAVTVAPGTAANAGATLTYRICDNQNVTNCDTAVVTVPVTAAPIDAVNDAGVSINGANGGVAVATVLVNDTLDGVLVTTGNVTLSLVSATPGLSLNVATGEVTVAAGTAANPAATLVYRICEVLNPTNCDTATVTVPVTAAAIDAVDDAGSANGLTGGTAVTNVLGNDTLNETPVVASAVRLTQVSTTNAGVTLSGANVVVAAGTPAGVYSLSYEICEVINPENCSIAVVAVTVTAPGINAVDDSGAVSTLTGGTAVANILANDTLNSAAVTTAQVTIAVASTLPAGITLSGTAVNVAAGTPSGTYMFDYRICDKLNPKNCDVATVTITVRGAEEGRMTGGGSVFRVNGQRVTHGFELHCKTTALPNNLQVNWGNGKKEQIFHLEALTTVSCSDDPRIVPEQPRTTFDTMVGTGVGRFNGVAGATVSFTLTDAGEPGTKDFAWIVVKDSRGRVVMEVKGNLQNGNQQAHTDN